VSQLKERENREKSLMQLITQLKSCFIRDFNVTNLVIANVKKEVA